MPGYKSGEIANGCVGEGEAEEGEQFKNVDT